MKFVSTRVYFILVYLGILRVGRLVIHCKCGSTECAPPHHAKPPSRDAHFLNKRCRLKALGLLASLTCTRNNPIRVQGTFNSNSTTRWSRPVLQPREYPLTTPFHTLDTSTGSPIMASSATEQSQSPSDAHAIATNIQPTGPLAIHKRTYQACVSPAQTSIVLIT